MKELIAKVKKLIDKIMEYMNWQMKEEPTKREEVKPVVDPIKPIESVTPIKPVKQEPLPATRHAISAFPEGKTLPLMNICGGHFGHSEIGRAHATADGKHGHNGSFPKPYELDYYLTKKGFEGIRMPMGMERIQHTLYGELDKTELRLWKKVVDAVLARGGMIIIEMHNDLRYTFAGEYTQNQPNEENVLMSFDGRYKPNALYDVWKKIAAEFLDEKYENKIVWGIDNEPHATSQDIVKEAMREGLKGIRDAGSKCTVILTGNNYTGASTWTGKKGHPTLGWVKLNESNADIFEGFIEKHDPLQKCIFDVHGYLDGNSSGAGITVPLKNDDIHIFEKQVKELEHWARYLPNGKKREKPYRFLLGETGIVNDGRAMQGLKKQIEHVEANSDVWVGWAYWAAGESWSDNYEVGISPKKGKDHPVMRAIVGADGKLKDIVSSRDTTTQASIERVKIRPKRWEHVALIGVKKEKQVEITFKAHITEVGDIVLGLSEEKIQKYDELVTATRFNPSSVIDNYSGKNRRYTKGHKPYERGTYTVRVNVDFSTGMYQSFVDGEAISRPVQLRNPASVLNYLSVYSSVGLTVSQTIPKG